MAGIQGGREVSSGCPFHSLNFEPCESINYFKKKNKQQIQTTHQPQTDAGPALLCSGAWSWAGTPSHLVGAGVLAAPGPYSQAGGGGGGAEGDSEGGPRLPTREE